MLWSGIGLRGGRGRLVKVPHVRCFRLLQVAAEFHPMVVNLCCISDVMLVRSQHVRSMIENIP